MKDVIIDSFRFLTRENRAIIYGFVIMPNHLHVVWQIPEPHILTEVKSALLSYTAHQFKRQLIKYNPDLLANYRVNLKDRVYQFWERNPLSVAIYQDEVFYQKMKYVHWNPCTERWKLAASPEMYRYSSAYLSHENAYWDFVTPG